MLRSGESIPPRQGEPHSREDFSLIAVSVSNLESFWRLLFAVLCGSILGWNRERLDKPAGLRTNMLVALGAATFMVIGLSFSSDLPDEEPAWMRLDVFRLVAGIIGGVGFLGAGSIIQSQGNVHGLTTAAAPWVSAATGTACGLGYYGIATMAVGLALVTLVAMALVERTFFGTADN